MNSQNVTNCKLVSRWGLIESSVITPEDSLSLTDLVLWPSVLYLSWQAAFSLTTEVILADRLSRDQTLVTSVRSVRLSNTKNITRWTFDIDKVEINCEKYNKTL